MRLTVPWCSVSYWRRSRNVVSHLQLLSRWPPHLVTPPGRRGAKRGDTVNILVCVCQETGHEKRWENLLIIWKTEIQSNVIKCSYEYFWIVFLLLALSLATEWTDENAENKCTSCAFQELKAGVTLMLNLHNCSPKRAVLPDTALCRSVLSAWQPASATDTSTPGSGSESSRECSPANEGRAMKENQTQSAAIVR